MKKLWALSLTLSFIIASGNLLAGSLTTCSGDAFDAEGYLLVNPDVKAAGVDACSHYTTHGKKEGRSPNPKNIQGQQQTETRKEGLIICDGVIFDSDGYLETNKDVKSAGVEPCKHYREFGKKEGRNPNPYNYSMSGGQRNDGLITCSGDLFDPDGYLLVNGDVKQAGVDACSHYSTHGKKEGRSPNPKNRGGQNTGPSGGMSNTTPPPPAPPVTPPTQVNNGNSGGSNGGGATSGSGQLLNGTADWERFLPTSIGEVWYNIPSTSDTIEYHHATHSILHIQQDYDQGLRAIGHLKVQGKSSGVVFAETIQKQGAIRADMTGENRYGNNHPMNVYGVGLGKDSVLKLPKNEVIVFTWTNKGTSRIMADLINPNADPAKNVNFKQCLNPGESTTIEYNPADYNDLKEWHQAIKSNMNSYHDCH